MATKKSCYLFSITFRRTNCIIEGASAQLDANYPSPHIFSIHPFGLSQSSQSWRATGRRVLARRKSEYIKRRLGAQSSYLYHKSTLIRRSLAEGRLRRMQRKPPSNVCANSVNVLWFSNNATAVMTIRSATRSDNGHSTG